MGYKARSIVEFAFRGQNTDSNITKMGCSYIMRFQTRKAGIRERVRVLGLVPSEDASF